MELTYIAMQPSLPAGGQKRLPACEFCRSRKIRCSSERPCANCFDYGRSCSTDSQNRRVRRKRNNATAESTYMAERLARLEAALSVVTGTDDLTKNSCAVVTSPIDATTVLQIPSPKMTPSMTDPIAYSHTTRLSTGSPNTIPASEDAPAEPVETEFAESFWFDDFSTRTATKDLMGLEPRLPGPVTPKSPAKATSTSGSNDFEASNGVDLHVQEKETSTTSQSGHPSIPIMVDDLSQAVASDNSYACPAYILIYSKDSVQWMSERAPTIITQGSSKAFMESSTIQTSVNLLTEGTCDYEEPDADTAWRYSNAYFENAPDTVFAIVDRSWYEGQLRRHLASPIDDPAWCALRNMVFALGGRIFMAQSYFSPERQHETWRYFQSAFSAHLQLLYTRPSLSGLQAMILMALFTAQLGGPHLEHSLSFQALRLAFLGKLNWDVDIEVSLPTSGGNSHRNLLFWATYCLEKQESNKSGVFHLTDDNNIYCSMPKKLPQGGEVSIFCHALVRLSQLRSIATQKLCSSRLRRNPAALAATVADLGRRLDRLVEAFAPVISFEKTPEMSCSAAGMNAIQTLYLYYAYYDLVFEIHGPLALPWLEHTFQGHVPALSLRRSRDMVAQASRKAIVATGRMQINSCTPKRVAVYGPLNAFVHLFLQIMLDPASPSAPPDFSLMEVGLTHFTFLKNATNYDVNLRLIQEMTACSSEALKRASRSIYHRQASPGTSTYSSSTTGKRPTNAVIERVESSPRLPSLDSPSMDFSDFDWHSWLQEPPVLSEYQELMDSVI